MRCWPERPLRVLIAPDAFKGSLTAAEAAGAIAAGWRRQRPQDRLDLCPLADGGDGFGLVLAPRLGAESRFCDTVDAAGRPRRARWWLAAGPPALAIGESADVIGMALLPPALRHPWPSEHRQPSLQGPDPGGLAGHGNSDSRGLDSRGLAPLLLAASAAGAERLLLGLGGSATNDAGFGLAQALGWRFLDAHGAPIGDWSHLQQLERVLPPPLPPPLPPLVIAVDVANPLLGPRGASAVYGPQKGLTAVQLPQAEACLQRLAQCLEERHPGLAERPGSGAAGGLGYGLQVFCGGRLQAGAELVAQLCELESRLEAADLVISGEGSFDGQSLMGKGVGRLLKRARRRGRDSLLLLGQLEGAALRQAQAAAAARGCSVEARALVPELTDLARACAEPALWLERLAQRAGAGGGPPSDAAAP
ncbi:MAG: glycerate kinase [Cyanobium sp.]